MYLTRGTVRFRFWCSGGEGWVVAPRLKLRTLGGGCKDHVKWTQMTNRVTGPSVKLRAPSEVLKCLRTGSR